MTLWQRVKRLFPWRLWGICFPGNHPLALATKGMTQKLTVHFAQREWQQWRLEIYQRSNGTLCIETFWPWPDLALLREGKNSNKFGCTSIVSREGDFSSIPNFFGASNEYKGPLSLSSHLYFSLSFLLGKNSLSPCSTHLSPANSGSEASLKSPQIFLAIFKAFKGPLSAHVYRLFSTSPAIPFEECRPKLNINVFPPPPPPMPWPEWPFFSPSLSDLVHSERKRRSCNSLYYIRCVCCTTKSIRFKDILLSISFSQWALNGLSGKGPRSLFLR